MEIRYPDSFIVSIESSLMVVQNELAVTKKDVSIGESLIDVGEEVEEILGSLLVVQLEHLSFRESE